MRKSLCEISNPKQWKTISTDMLTETGYPVYGANGIIGYYSTYNHDCETLLITCRGATCGSLNICQPFSYVNGNAMALDSLSADIDIRYLYYYLLNRGLNDVITGSAQPQIVRQSLEKVIVEYPELNIQKSIVETLDKISKIIFLRKQQLSKLDELVKSRFIEMFGDPVSNPFKWSTLTMKQASIRLSDGPFGSNLKSEHYTHQGVRVIRLGNIGCGYFNDEDQSYISQEHYETIKKYTCRSGEIVIATLGDPNLRACIIPDHIDYGVNKSDCVHYVPKTEILNNQFVCQYINCPETLSLASGMVHGQTRSRISSGQLADLPIYLPPMDLQQQFATLVEQIDKSKFEIQKSLEKLETLKKALMQKYFSEQNRSKIYGKF